MLSFLKRIFGVTSSPAPRRHDLPARSKTEAGRREPDTTQQDLGRGTCVLSGKAAVDEYFKLSGMIEEAKSSGDFERAVRAARRTLPLMPAVVAEMKREYGSFDISTSHAVHTGGTLMAVIGDRSGIRKLKETLLGTPELNQWLPTAEQAESDFALVEGIVAAIQREPGIKQSELKQYVSGDGRRLSVLASWLEKGGRIRRVSQPPTFRLYSASFDLSTVAPEERPRSGAPSTGTSTVTLARSAQSRSAARARLLQVGKLPYIRLPKAPIGWEERARTGDSPACAHEENSEAQSNRSGMPRFIVSGSGWSLLSEIKLSGLDRPNPAYRQMFATIGSTFWLDPKGRREDFPEAPAVAMTTNSDGVKVAERGLKYDVYRTDVNGDGSGALFMSTEGILHGYSEQLEPIIEESVETLPEYTAQAKRFGIAESQLKSHVRCVALTTDRRRYLLTAVDEAWCYDVATGQPIWGIRFPSKEGWTEVVSERSARVGVSADVNAALKLMELSLPVSPDEITRRYRALAMRWHPDRNQGRPEFTQRFQELGAAMELLTGLDVSHLSSSEVETVSYEQMLHRTSVTLKDGRTVTLLMSLQIGGAFGTDWIYAANFARSGQNAYLAGYSGRVIEVDARGDPVCIYDVGAVPKQIEETLSRRYILTDTRLYVLFEGKLEAIVDVFDQGKLIITDHGFGHTPRSIARAVDAPQSVSALSTGVHRRDPYSSDRVRPKLWHLQASPESLL